MAQRVIVPVVILAVAGLVVTIASQVSVIRVSGDSMAPAARNGDLLVCRLARSRARCGVGDLVVFRMPIREDRRVMAVKRVAGLAGDVAEGSGGPLEVPPGHLFLLADQSRGVDSRVLGPIPVHDVVGIVLFVVRSGS